MICAPHARCIILLLPDSTQHEKRLISAHDSAASAWKIPRTTVVRPPHVPDSGGIRPLFTYATRSIGARVPISCRRVHYSPSSGVGAAVGENVSPAIVGAALHS